MTLSRFLRDYLYIPLGGNRRGPRRRYLNILITMLLGGLWHGAGWTFVLWGFLHGLYLVLNGLWQELRRALWPGPPDRSTRAGRMVATALTFLCVAVTWVFFRAETLGGALTLLRSMARPVGAALPGPLAHFFAGGVRTAGDAAALLPDPHAWLWITAGACIVFLLPASHELFHERIRDHLYIYSRKQAPTLRHAIRLTWKPNLAWGLAIAGLLTTALYLAVYAQNRITEFIYFNF
jgi:hypothetical protein